MYSDAIWMFDKEGHTFALYLGLLSYSVQENVSIFIMFIIVTGAVMFFILFVFSKSKITKLTGRENIMSSLNQIWRSVMRYLSLLWCNVLLMQHLCTLLILQPSFSHLFYQIENYTYISIYQQCRATISTPLRMKTRVNIIHKYKVKGTLSCEIKIGIVSFKFVCQYYHILRLLCFKYLI